jgi:hypothetical protein
VNHSGHIGGTSGGADTLTCSIARMRIGEGSMLQEKFTHYWNDGRNTQLTMYEGWHFKVIPNVRTRTERQQQDLQLSRQQKRKDSGCIGGLTMVSLTTSEIILSPVRERNWSRRVALVLDM